MFRNSSDNINHFRAKNPEEFKKRVSKLTIGLGISAFIIVAAVNVASVITVFPPVIPL